MEIIEKKFPRNSTAFDIYEINHGFSIKKKKGEAPTLNFPNKPTENYMARAKLRSFTSQKSNGEKWFLSLNGKSIKQGVKIEIS